MCLRRCALAVFPLVVLMGSGCAPIADTAVAAVPKDGELAAPRDYRSWPKFLSAIQRPDAKQVREIYMNPVATAGTYASGFPNGTIFVMENYAAVLNPDGTVKPGPDGKLIRGELMRVFVMGKNPRWGDSAPPGLKNGDWIYSSFLANGDKAPESTAACRSCHLPLDKKDFVQRYDEYFGKATASAAHIELRMLAQLAASRATLRTPIDVAAVP
jgi:Cytochrome P460